MTPDGTFEDVLEAARRGVPEAAAELWTRYSGGVARYARAKGSAEPDDLTSEVFLAVFRDLPRFTGDEAAFRALLFTIAHRRLVDELRRRARRVETVAWSEDTDRRTVASAEESALSGLGAAEAQELLARLAPDQRDVLVLRIFGDLTVEQVARILGKNIGAVKALQRRGLEALRRTLPALQQGTDPAIERSA